MKRTKILGICLGLSLVSLAGNVFAADLSNEKTVIADTTIDREPAINSTKTKSLTTTAFTKIVSDNNLLNEKVTIIFDSVPDGSKVKKIKVKVIADTGTTIIAGRELAVSDMVSFNIDWNGEKYTVYAKSLDVNGEATIQVRD